MTTQQINTKRIDDEQKERTQRAFRLLLILGIVVFTAGMASLIRIWATNEYAFHPDLVEPGAGIAGGLIIIGASFIAKRGYVTGAVILVAITFYAVDYFLLSRLGNVGLPLTVATTAGLIIIASQVLPKKQVVSGVGFIFFTGATFILLDLFWPTTRELADQADLQIIYAAAVLIIVTGVFVAMRQFSTFSLRTKMVSVAIMLVVITVFLTTILVNNFTRTALTQELDAEFQLVGGLQALTVSELLSRQIEILEGLSLDSGLRTALVTQNNGFRYSGTEEESLDALLASAEEWPTNFNLQSFLSTNTPALTLRGLQGKYPNHTQLAVVDKWGALLGATYVPSTYYYGSEDWWQYVNEGGGSVHIGEPHADEATGQITMDIVVPIYDVRDPSVINGFVISNYSLIEVAALLQRTGDIGETGHWDLIFKETSLHLAGQSAGLQLTEFDEGLLNTLLEAPGNIIAGVEGERSLVGLVPVDSVSETTVIDDLGWLLVVSQSEEEAFATVKVQQQVAIIMALVAIIIGAVIAMYAAGYIANPINRLTETAVIISEGNLNRRASVETEDEIGTLALAFNRMTDQIRNFISSLEEQVLERTKALATSTEVSRQLSTILNMDELVAEIVNQIRNSFGYYHAQIYLYDETKEYLVMAGGTGSAGQKMLESGHKLAHGRGLVGRAAELNQVVLISDVTRDKDWLANELLPHTQSEAAVPIVLGSEVLGVLDVQHNVAGGLDEEGVALLQSIANQIAIAIQNAHQYEQTQLALAESERLYNVAEEQAQRLAVLNEMSAEFSTAVSEEDVYAIVGKNLLRMISGDRASITLLDANDKEKAEVILLGGEAFDQIDRTQISLSETAIGLATLENRIVLLPSDAPLTDFADGRLFVERGFQSLMIVPLQFGGKVLGTLNIGNKQRQELQESGIDFIQQVASTIAINLESVRISERAKLLASIVENHPDFIGVGTLTGEALYINPSGMKLLSLPPDITLADVDASKIYSPEDGAALLSEGVPAALKTGSWTAEVTVNRFDGTTVPVEETIGINYDVNNQPVSFSMTMRDISERKEAEMAVQQSRDLAEEFQEKLKTLYQITVGLSKESDLDMVFRKAVEDGRSKLGLDRLGFWLFNETVTEMHGAFGTNIQGEMEDARHRRVPIAENVDGGWILPFINDNQRYLVNEDANLYDDDGHIVGHGWQVVVIMWNEEQPLGFLSVDNLVLQQSMKPYEPDLVILFANALSNIVVNKRAEAARAKQARELQTVAEVSRTATTILDMNELLQQTVDLTQEQFNLYHAHIYLMNHSQEFLVLTAGSGEVGRIMVAERREIPLRSAQSLVAQAARTKQSIVVNSVQMAPGFLPNPLLPDTRAELATPIMVGDEVLGVLDVQSNKVNHFSQSDIDVQMTLASQIAVAMQNAKQYQRTQEALENVTRMQQLLVKDGWKTFVENEAEAVQGYRFDQQSLQPMSREEDTAVDHDETLLLPLTVRGASIGKLGVRDSSGRPVSKEKQELLQSMTAQVAEALERARLFQQTEVARMQTEAALKETRRRTEELAAINQIVTDLGASLDISQSMNIVVTGITQSLGVEQCRIALLDDDGQSLTIVAEEFNIEKSVSALGISIPIAGNALTQEVMETRHPIVIDDVANDPRVDVVRELLQAQGIKGLVVLPMIVGTTVLGTVGIDLLQEGQRFTEDQVELAQTIIFQAATAVQNARLYSETQRRAEKERLVNTINQKIQGTTTVESALQTAIEELGRALHAQKTRVALHLEKSQVQEGNGRNGTN